MKTLHRLLQRRPVKLGMSSQLVPSRRAEHARLLILLLVALAAFTAAVLMARGPHEAREFIDVEQGGR